MIVFLEIIRYLVKLLVTKALRRLKYIIKIFFIIVVFYLYNYNTEECLFIKYKNMPKKQRPNIPLSGLTKIQKGKILIIIIMIIIIIIIIILYRNHKKMYNVF